MMQRWSSDDQLPNGLGISHTQQPHEQDQVNVVPLQSNGGSEQFQEFAMPPQMQQDMFDSPAEYNRRTLTQDQFNAIARNGGMVNSSGDFETFQADFSGNQDVFNQVFPEFGTHDFKQQEVFAFPHPVGAPLSSNDSTLASSISEQSLAAFPSSSAMQIHPNPSANSSEWGDSRSSSICVQQHDGPMNHMSATQQQSAATTSQWQPGQSVPVDFNQLNQEFRRVAQAAAQARQSPQQEQPLAWPADEAFARRDSQASLLAQSMSNVGINTPQTQQPGTFKVPTPMSTIAARRQRKPAPIPLGSLRSQSYSGTVPPVSPGQAQQQQNYAPHLRRIRSSNVVNGAVAQGRIMKSAQRSPLNWTFADPANSTTRHVSAQSQGSLAPPTPLSPSEFPRQEQAHQFPVWQSSSGQTNSQPTINESDFEHGIPYQPSASVPAQNSSSPPHTPMHFQQHFVQRVGNNVITENTPPQSAPAAQQCFPSNIFGAPQHQHSQSQAPSLQPMQAMAVSHPQQYMNVIVPEAQAQAPSVTFAPTQHANVTSSGPPPGAPLQFANGVPMRDAEGNVTMAFPPQLQFMQQQQAQAQVQPPPQQMQTPPQVNYPFMTSSGASPGMHAAAQMPKQAPQPSAEFFVHEYTPPQDLKRSATPRKPVDSGPKNYSFSNTGPEHFGDKKGKKSDAKSCSGSTGSPAGSSVSV